jgi:hypothetical protein
MRWYRAGLRTPDQAVAAFTASGHMPPRGTVITYGPADDGEHSHQDGDAPVQSAEAGVVVGEVVVNATAASGGNATVQAEKVMGPGVVAVNDGGEVTGAAGAVASTAMTGQVPPLPSPGVSPVLTRQQGSWDEAAVRALPRLTAIQQAGLRYGRLFSRMRCGRVRDRLVCLRCRTAFVSHNKSWSL